VADELLPASIVKSAPIPIPEPTSILIAPATPFNDEPEDKTMEPEELLSESPVDNLMLPLTPAEPASVVASSNFPELVCELWPLETLI
jgi:hypothetical protein